MTLTTKRKREFKESPIPQDIKERTAFEILSPNKSQRSFTIDNCSQGNNIHFLVSKSPTIPFVRHKPKDSQNSTIQDDLLPFTALINKIGDKHPLATPRSHPRCV